ncbi:MAG: hypothetical protein MJ003_03060 [Paludibacteraceae bacterium]|nr:hypothetical protein [Paludibacteraceae bacterium]
MEQKNMNIEMYDRYEAELLQQLVTLCNERGLLSGKLPSSVDIEDKWKDLSADFMVDAVREYNSYPLATLAWTAYIGAAVAHWWDTDWKQNKTRSYKSLLGFKGFDDMDEHIVQNVLHYKLGDDNATMLDNAFHLCADKANNMLLHQGVEPGSTDAFYLFVRTLRVMYIIGASVHLKQLGYSMQKFPIVNKPSV